MNWLCNFGIHKLLPVMRPNPDPETVWLFGALISTGVVCCARCNAKREVDSTPPPGDYD